MSFKRLMVKQTGKLWHIRTTEYYAVRQESKTATDTCNDSEETRGSYAGREKANLKKLPAQHFIYTTFLK